MIIVALNFCHDGTVSRLNSFPAEFCCSSQVATSSLEKDSGAHRCNLEMFFLGIAALSVEYRNGWAFLRETGQKCHFTGRQPIKGWRWGYSGQTLWVQMSSTAVSLNWSFLFSLQVSWAGWFRVCSKTLHRRGDLTWCTIILYFSLSLFLLLIMPLCPICEWVSASTATPTLPLGNADIPIHSLTL